VLPLIPVGCRLYYEGEPTVNLGCLLEPIASLSTMMRSETAQRCILLKRFCVCLVEAPEVPDEDVGGEVAE
jgi:hypothetical protein